MRSFSMPEGFVCDAALDEGRIDPVHLLLDGLERLIAGELQLDGFAFAVARRMGEQTYACPREIDHRPVAISTAEQEFGPQRFVETERLGQESRW